MAEQCASRLPLQVGGIEAHYPERHHEIYNYEREVLATVPVVTSWYEVLDQLQ